MNRKYVAPDIINFPNLKVVDADERFKSIRNGKNIYFQRGILDIISDKQNVDRIVECSLENYLRLLYQPEMIEISDFIREKFDVPVVYINYTRGSFHYDYVNNEIVPQSRIIR